mmetsp:Transcript_21139/g.32420  ORF Transcript_21139/g.32420 Transcript_21139/m.32420 type:complete len:497 (-) Transcript_21139:2406-3896(-)
MASIAKLMQSLGLPTSFAKQEEQQNDQVKKEEIINNKECKHCRSNYPAIMFAPKQWQKKKPTCYACSEKLRSGEKIHNTDIESTRISAIRQQLEYYFGEKNWSTDTYLRSLADARGIPLSAVCAFPRLAQMLQGQGQHLVQIALKESNIVSLSKEGDRLIRIETSEDHAQNKRKRSSICQLEIDDEENERRARRANRFITTTTNMQQVNDIDLEKTQPTEETDDGEEFSSGFFRGTCQKIEKSYLRLTSAPKPEQVRPLEILKLALKQVSTRYQQDEDYPYARNQLKAIRQDLTVQNISGFFAAQVYEAHARIALAESDFDEFAQCQSRLIEIHAQPPFSQIQNDLQWQSVIEFSAYRLLYAIAVAGCRSLEAARALQQVLRTKSYLPESTNTIPIDHALAITSALNLEQYQTFFTLYHSTPNSGAYLLDGLLPVLRKRAYLQIKRALLPQNKFISLNRLTAALGFFGQHEQCRAYLISNTDGAFLPLLVERNEEN